MLSGIMSESLHKEVFSVVMPAKQAGDDGLDSLGMEIVCMKFH